MKRLPFSAWSLKITKKWRNFHFCLGNVSNLLDLIFHIAGRVGVGLSFAKERPIEKKDI